MTPLNILILLTIAVIAIVLGALIARVVLGLAFLAAAGLLFALAGLVDLYRFLRRKLTGSRR